MQDDVSSPESPAQQNRLADFFTHAEHAFDQAASRAGTCVRYFRIAGQGICFRLAGQRVTDAITPVFAHLAMEQGAMETDLTILLWDSKSSGIEMPALPWDRSRFSARGDIEGVNHSRFKVSFPVFSGMVHLLDADRGRAIFWVKDIQQLDAGTRAKPLLHIFHWWLLARQCQILHGGIIGLPSGAAFLAGLGGAGKSTTALSCLAADLFYLADDLGMIETGNTFQAHSLFCSGMLYEPDLRFLPFLKPAVCETGRTAADKTLLLLHPHFRRQLTSSLPLSVIFLPRLCDRIDTTWQPAPIHEARRALMGCTINMLLSSTLPVTIRNIARIVKHVPCYYLNLGKDRQKVPAAIRSALECFNEANGQR